MGYGEMAAKFGTSGLRGLSTDLVGDTTLIHTLAFGRYLLETGQISEYDKIYLGRDFRDSSPRIAELCANALLGLNLVAVDCGTLPTPALACHAMRNNSASMMITGSHIPADRNGIKFYRPDGEISKDDEAEITRFASLVTAADLAKVKRKSTYPAQTTGAAEASFKTRLRSILEPDALAGLHVGVYQHSTVARDLLAGVLEGYGAKVSVLGRSESFIPVDTEAVSEDTAQLLKAWAREHKLDAIVSADGDGDRPLVADETGQPLRGDLLGLISARHLGADAVVTPVTSNSSIDANASFETVRTRVGSPYVITGMKEAAAAGKTAVVGFEANGGVLLQSDFDCGSGVLEALPTRDCFVPILAVLQVLARTGTRLSNVVAGYGLKTALADRLTDYAGERSASLMSHLRNADENLRDFLKPIGQVVSINTTDGLRISLDGDRIIHLRPSGNAPEMRCYVEAPTEADARSLLKNGLALLSDWNGADVSPEPVKA